MGADELLNPTSCSGVKFMIDGGLLPPLSPAATGVVSATRPPTLLLAGVPVAATGFALLPFLVGGITELIENIEETVTCHVARSQLS